ncbi:MAG: hypothetical protein WC375_06235 [Methanomassiliicoccales archaeon]|jgi:hypothetical protein
MIEPNKDNEIEAVNSNDGSQEQSEEQHTEYIKHSSNELPPEEEMFVSSSKIDPSSISTLPSGTAVVNSIAESSNSINDFASGGVLNTKMFGKLTRYMLTQAAMSCTSFKAMSQRLGYAGKMNGELCNKIRSIVPNIHLIFQDNKQKLLLGEKLPDAPQFVRLLPEKVSEKVPQKPKKKALTGYIVPSQEEKVQFSCLELGDRFWLDGIYPHAEVGDKYAMKWSETEAWIPDYENIYKSFGVSGDQIVRKLQGNLQRVLEKYNRIPASVLEPGEIVDEFVDDIGELSTEKHSLRLH